jgi:hypothetical protein
MPPALRGAAFLGDRFAGFFAAFFAAFDFFFAMDWAPVVWANRAAAIRALGAPNVVYRNCGGRGSVHRFPTMKSWFTPV